MKDFFDFVKITVLCTYSNGARGIHTAAKQGHAGVINAVIAKGEDVNVLTNDHYSALHLAIEAGKSAVVECLLGHGANVHITGGPDNETPLHMACRIGEARGEKCAKMLLKSGANPNLPMSNGRTPLHISAQSGGVHNIRLLLENGANVSSEDSNGETAVHMAVRGCHFKTLKVIYR
jgi:ankyrin repeat protein